MRSFAFIASDSLLITIIPLPSPRTYPFADESKALHLPSGDKKFPFDRETVDIGFKIRFDPPTMARLILFS